MNWKKAKLGEICDVIAGQSPKGKNYNKEGNGMPFYQGKKDYGEKYLNPPSFWTTEVTKTAIAKDILMSVRAPVGDINIATEDICIGRGLAAIRVKENVCNEFIYYSLLRRTKNLNKRTGAIFDSITKKQIEDLNIWLPTLENQKKIAYKIEELFSSIDKSVNSTKQKKEELLNFKISYLKLLIDHKFEDNYSKTLSEFSNKNWKVAKLGDISHFVRGLTYSKNDEVEVSNNSIIRATNIDLETHSLVLDDLRYISDNVSIKSKLYAKKGDILICTSSGSKKHLGKVALIESDTSMAIGGFIGMIRCKDFCNPKYLYYILSSTLFKSHLSTVSEGANINNLRFSQIENFEFVLPPVTIQNRIILKIDSMFCKCNNLIQTVDKILVDFQTLKSVILDKELIPDKKNERS